MTSPGWSNQLMTIFEARELPRRAATAGRTRRVRVPACDGSRARNLRETLRREPAIDNTTVVALGRVYGSFFDDV